MEIMCEYFEHGYKILFNFGDSGIRNGMELVNDAARCIDIAQKLLDGKINREEDYKVPRWIHKRGKIKYLICLSLKN
jgi:hypothetical protein